MRSVDAIQPAPHFKGTLLRDLLCGPDGRVIADLDLFDDGRAAAVALQDADFIFVHETSGKNAQRNFPSLFAFVQKNSPGFQKDSKSKP
jgi:hypothetical protein